jgi:N-acetylneuraminic acid mutarotase
MPTPRGGVASAVVGWKVFAFGGEGNPEEGSNGVFDQVEVYDTCGERWEKLGPMGVPRHGTSAVGVAGAVYIPGGGVALGGAPTDVFDVYYP